VARAKKKLAHHRQAETPVPLFKYRRIGMHPGACGHHLPKWSILEQPSFTIPFNVTGQPAMSVCAGFGALGLPVSIQPAGKPFAEATLLRAAHAFEQATQWRNQRAPTVRIGAVGAG
jgi:Asp-tRNA(Asn)/Glu-tRNA(Gln) amidotransferase A subunit family amidase